MITREKLIEAFNDDLPEKEKWLRLIAYSKNNNDYEVKIDNDDISIIFDDDEDSWFTFDEFGYEALCTLLNSSNIKADMV